MENMRILFLSFFLSSRGRLESEEIKSGEKKMWLDGEEESGHYGNHGFFSWRTV